MVIVGVVDVDVTDDDVGSLDATVLDGVKIDVVIGIIGVVVSAGGVEVIVPVVVSVFEVVAFVEDFVTALVLADDEVEGDVTSIVEGALFL